MSHQQNVFFSGVKLLSLCLVIPFLHWYYLVSDRSFKEMFYYKYCFIGKQKSLKI